MSYRHGGPYDRGAADAYYNRPERPHYYKGATGLYEVVEEADMTADEIAEYMQGYDEETNRKDFR